MKLRMLISALCICMSICAMAQGPGRGNRGGKPQSFDMVVDTAIINSMDLEPELVTAVLQLQAQKQEELKATLIKMAQSRQEGQGFDQEAIASMRQQMEDFKLEYRMALRKLLGTANYITYLEKQIDKRPEAPRGNMRNGRGAQRPQGGGWNQGMGQQGMNQGNGNWGEDNGFEDAK